MFRALISIDCIDDRLVDGLPAGSKVYAIDHIRSRLERLRAENDPIPHRIVEVALWYNPRLGVVKPTPGKVPTGPALDWSSTAEEKPRGVLRVKATIPADLLFETRRGYIPAITRPRRHADRRPGGIGAGMRFTRAQLLELCRAEWLPGPDIGITEPPAPKVTAPGLWEPGLYAFVHRYDYERGRQDRLTLMERDEAMQVWHDLPDEATAVGDPFDPHELTAQNTIVVYAALKTSRDGDCLEVLGLHAPKGFDREWVVELRSTHDGSMVLGSSIAPELLGRFNPATGRLTMDVE